jgi:hypothetical protein
MAAAIALLSSAAHAQLRASAAPADPSARVPRLTYESAFRDFRRYDEVEVRSWRQSNDEVRGVPGPSGYEKGGPAAQKPNVSGVPNPPAPGGHEGHAK